MSGDRVGNQPQPRYDPLAALDYIDSYQRTHANRSPSLRRICSDLNIATPSIGYRLLYELERAEMLTVVASGHGQPADALITEIGQQQLREWRSTRSQPAGPRSEDER